MHLEVFRPYLTNLAAENQNNPLGYLWEFGPVHNWWHGRPSATRPIGFLTFHHLVINTFGSTFPGGVIPVEPSSLFTFPGVLRNPDQFVRTLNDLEEYSDDIEGWHNQVHNAIGGEFMDASRNVYLRNFWEFHTFINDRFNEGLAGLGKSFNDFLQEATEAQIRAI